jgi:hypothetical protein
VRIETDQRCGRIIEDKERPSRDFRWLHASETFPL